MKNKLKLMILIFALISNSIMFSSGVFAFADDIVDIYLDNKLLEFKKNKPLNIEGNVFVPGVDIAKVLGCEATYDSKEQILGISNADYKFVFQINNDNMVAHGSKSIYKEYNNIPTPHLINGEIYIPIRPLAFALDYGVKWDNQKKAIILMSTNISYVDLKTFSTFAGTGEEASYPYTNCDGTIDKMKFHFLNTIDISSDGTIYAGDFIGIRKISKGSGETIDTNNLSAGIIHCYGKDVYFASDYESDYIAKRDGNTIKTIFKTNKEKYAIKDFQIDSAGNIYVIYTELEDNSGSNKKTQLGKINTSTNEIEGILKLDEGFCNIAVDNYDNLYISNSTYASIYYCNLKDKVCYKCAGINGERFYVDGANGNETLYKRPTKIKYNNGYLYIVDDGLLRRTAVNKGVALKTETIGGRIDKYSGKNPLDSKIFAKDAVLNSSYDFAVQGDKVYITDRDANVIRIIE